MSKKALQPPRLQLVGEVISTYTRAQPLEDGVLIDAGALAQEAGYRWPVALTTAAWEDCVAWSEADNARQVHQDEAGRLWDVLFLGVHALRTRVGDGAWLQYSLYRIPRDRHSKQAKLTSLKMMVGPGDDGEPVITVLLRNED